MKHHFNFLLQGLDLTIVEEDGKIVGIEHGNRDPENSERKLSKLIEKASQEIELYLKGELSQFSVEVELRGTEFQKLVWKALESIPYGETRTYGEIAKSIGSPLASRAVGMACNKNPLPIIVPCHRVVGRGGKLTGFGWGIEVKKKLLKIEMRRMILQ